MTRARSNNPSPIIAVNPAPTGPRLARANTTEFLAGVWHELHAKDVDGDEITEFFRKLDKHMEAPVDDESIWRVTQTAETSNPTLRRQIMRTQNLQHLAAVITNWFTNPPAEL